MWIGLLVIGLAGVGGVLGARYLRGPRTAQALVSRPPVATGPSQLSVQLREVARVLAGPLQRVAVPAAQGPEVVFTFDDGPDHALTGQVLDTLAAHRVRAVFFVNGKNLGGKSETAQARRALLRRAHAEGHLIGNHTQSHLHLCQISEARGAEEIEASERAIEKVIGSRSVLFRTPYGDKCSRVTKVLAAAGVEHTHWDIDPQEWKTRDAALAFSAVTGQIARAEGRVIVLMHDIQPATIAALPKILTWIDEEIAARAPQVAAAADKAKQGTELGVLRSHKRTGKAGLGLTVAAPEVLLAAKELPMQVAIAAPMAVLAAAIP
ncbi:MAG: polysaccharide deacetylase family protein [Deltaproteobacteria bacterium]|nr:polysaccharide deacetylase family protein [Deltaproteobacteria bacterium]